MSSMVIGLHDPALTRNHPWRSRLIEEEIRGRAEEDERRKKNPASSPQTACPSRRMRKQQTLGDFHTKDGPKKLSEERAARVVLASDGTLVLDEDGDSETMHSLKGSDSLTKLVSSPPKFHSHADAKSASRRLSYGSVGNQSTTASHPDRSCGHRPGSRSGETYLEAQKRKQAEFAAERAKRREAYMKSMAMAADSIEAPQLGRKYTSLADPALTAGHPWLARMQASYGRGWSKCE